VIEHFLQGLPLKFLFTEKSTGIAFKVFIYRENFWSRPSGK